MSFLQFYNGNLEYETTALRERRRKYVVLSFVLTQNERTKEKVKTDEKYG